MSGVRPSTTSVSEPRYAVGVDVGGTFTDFVAMDMHNGEVRRAKVLSTQDDPSRAILDGLGLLFDGPGDFAQVSVLVHGTTRAGNALIERKGATVGFITTQGFRDVLEMGNEMRYDLYDLSIRRAPPLVSRRMRRGVDERVDADGQVVIALDETSLRKTARALVDEGATSLAIGFLHSYLDPRHENQARSIVEEEFPNVPVSISHEVAPEIREYERFSTTVANAYIVPLVDTYLRSLAEQLQQRGFRGDLLIMLSGGGVGSVDAVRAMPVHIIESGPAGGILAAAHAARDATGQRVLAFDMGGTTAKLSIVENGVPRRSHGFEIARVHRFRRGSGLPLRLPVVDLVEIGAGGGSIAWIDGMGLLKVGPESAGADPGPACYGLGGTMPTVTDADLVLGILDPSYFLGGDLTLDTDAARQALDEHLARPLGIDIEQAARGVFTIVSENMAQAARMYLAERGVDPRTFTLVASGGAGPVHAYEVARLLRIPRVLYPYGAGVASAQGFLVAPPRVDVARSAPTPLDAMDQQAVHGLLEAMDEEALERLGALGVHRSDTERVWSVDMRYVGQGFEVEVGVDRDRLDPATLHERFERTYRTDYGRSIDDVAIELVTWRLVASGPAPRLPNERIVRSRSSAGRRASRAVRDVMVTANGPIPCAVIDRYELDSGSTFDGPAVVQERESTIFVGPGATGRVDDRLNVVVTVGSK